MNEKNSNFGGKHKCQNICSIQLPVYKSLCHIKTWDLCMKLDKHVLMYMYYNFRTLSSKTFFSKETFLKLTLVLGQATEVKCFGWRVISRTHAQLQNKKNCWSSFSISIFNIVITVKYIIILPVIRKQVSGIWTKN